MTKSLNRGQLLNVQNFSSKMTRVRSWQVHLPCICKLPHTLLNCLLCSCLLSQHIHITDCHGFINIVTIAGSLNPNSIHCLQKFHTSLQTWKWLTEAEMVSYTFRVNFVDHYSFAPTLTS